MRAKPLHVYPFVFGGNVASMTSATQSSTRSKRTVRRIKKGPAALLVASDGNGDGRSPASGLLVQSNTSLDLLGAAALLPWGFYQIDGLDLAPRLLGKLLGRDEVVLQITEIWDYCTDGSSGALELLDGPELKNILGCPRVGIDYALHEHVNEPWWFAFAGSRWANSPKSTLKPY